MVPDPFPKIGFRPKPQAPQAVCHMTFESHEFGSSTNAPVQHPCMSVPEPAHRIAPVSPASCANLGFSPLPQGASPPFGFSPVPPRASTAEQQPAPAPASGPPLSRALLIEVCAGSAVLSKAVKKAGMRALPIDKSASRASGIKIITLDLTRPRELDTLVHMMRSEQANVLLLWFAPPCGAASRAREKPLPPFAKAGLKIPVPLRSDARPDGLDRLAARDRLRAEESNQLYSAMTELVEEALRLKLHVAVEIRPIPFIGKPPSSLR